LRRKEFRRAPARAIRILYVDTEVVWRGGQEQLLGLMTGMMERGHEVWLATPPSSPLGERVRGWGVGTVPFAQACEISLTALIRFWAILRRLRPDILHFNTPKPITVGSIAGRWIGTPVIVSSRRVNFPLKTRVSVFKYNWLLDQVFTVSESIRNTLIQAGVKPQLVETIYEGVDLDWFDSLQEVDLPNTDQAQIVGTVAHLSPEKGHEVLLDAVRILTDRGIRLQLLIVGDGQLRAQLEAKAAELGIESSVSFLGFRADSEALMKEFDVFCLPSLSEGLSSAILAAMANSLPVVSTSVGGIPELVVDGETGFLVPPGNPSALAEALEKVLTDARLRTSLGRMGRQRIETFFILDRKLTRTEEAYQRLLSEVPIG